MVCLHRACPVLLWVSQQWKKEEQHPQFSTPGNVRPWGIQQKMSGYSFKVSIPRA